MTKYSQVPLSIKMNVPEGEYLTLEELGEVLRQLAYPTRDERTKGTCTY